MVNLFSRHMWPTVNVVRQMLYGALQDCLHVLKPKDKKQAEAQATAIPLVFARWCALTSLPPRLPSPARRCSHARCDDEHFLETFRATIG